MKRENQPKNAEIDSTNADDWRKGKRSKGSSSKIVKGRLYARIQYVDELGNRREKLKPARGLREVPRLCREMRNELEQKGAAFLHADKITFAQLADKYEKHKVKPPTYADGRKVAGLRSYKSTRSFVKALNDRFGKMRIRQIKPSDIEAYKLERLNGFTVRGGKRATASVHRELAILRAMLNFAVREGWLVQSPVVRVESFISPDSERERERVLSYAEETRLLDACDQTNKQGKLTIRHLRPILIALLDTGMRKGELLKLCWQDVDLDERTIFIQVTNTKIERERTIGMTDRLHAELVELWRRSPRDRRAEVFGIGSIKHSFETACDRAGIKDFRPHDCRHTATTRMIQAGIPHAEVMKITGHRQMKTFLRYLNLNKDSRRRTAELLSLYNTARLVESDSIIETVQ